MSHDGAALTDTSDMLAVHQVFRSSFAACPELMAGAAHDEARRALIANYYDNLLAFLEVHHHGEEELVFPLLRDRAPAELSVVATAEMQHADVLGLLQSARATVSAWDAGGADGGAAQEALEVLHRALVDHLDEEEAHILPLAARYLSAEEWGVLPGHGIRNFTGDKVWLILGLIRENMTQEQRDLMLEHMPPPPRQMWESMGEASFTELIAQVRAIG